MVQMAHCVDARDSVTHQSGCAPAACGRMAEVPRRNHSPGRFERKSKCHGLKMRTRIVGPHIHRRSPGLKAPSRVVTMWIGRRVIASRRAIRHRGTAFVSGRRDIDPI